MSKIAYFFGPTRIKGKQGNLYAEDGNYNTITRVSNFQQNAKIETPNYLLGGDKLVYDEAAAVRRGHRQRVDDFEERQHVMRGDVGRYWRGTGPGQGVRRPPVVRNISEKDTLYLAADTLVSVEGQPGQTTAGIVYAYPKVRIFRARPAGHLRLADLRPAGLHHLPEPQPGAVEDKNQLTADSMEIRQRRGKIDQMRLYANAFTVDQDTLLNFNQVKGRNMVAYFRENKLQRVDVLGNAESIYYALEGDTATTGMNRAVAPPWRCASPTASSNHHLPHQPRRQVHSAPRAERTR